MNVEIIQKAYAHIGDHTPLLSDCGALCGAACCQPDADGQGGVYLFPGEYALFDAESDDFAPLFTCDGTCTRAMRPLGCRIFPLTPVRTKTGWTVRLDRRARAMCPLTASGLNGLNRDFVRAVRKALLTIAADPQGEAFLIKWQALEDEFRNSRL